MQQEQHSLRMIERFAVDAHVGRRRFLADVSGRLAADGDAPGPEPIARLAAAAIPEVGEKLIEAAHGEVVVWSGEIERIHALLVPGPLTVIKPPDESPRKLAAIAGAVAMCPAFSFLDLFFGRAAAAASHCTRHQI